MYDYYVGQALVNICFPNSDFYIDWKYGINYRNHCAQVLDTDPSTFNVLKIAQGRVMNFIDIFVEGRSLSTNILNF